MALPEIVSFNGVGMFLYGIVFVVVLIVGVHPQYKCHTSWSFVTVVAMLAAVRVGDYCVLLWLRPEGAGPTNPTYILNSNS